MSYQLVLQWPASSLQDYDAMVEIESVLSGRLSTGAEIDGHDAGSGEMNIFIHTDDPTHTFQEIRTILGSQDFWVNARVAYRELRGSRYTILWPDGMNHFKVS